jgi:hypothetical protein
MKIPNKIKILKRAAKIMEVHEEAGYIPGHIVGYSDYEESLRHMKHCIYLAVDEWKENLGLLNEIKQTK